MTILVQEYINEANVILDQKPRSKSWLETLGHVKNISQLSKELLSKLERIQENREVYKEQAQNSQNAGTKELRKS